MKFLGSVLVSVVLAGGCQQILGIDDDIHELLCDAGVDDAGTLREDNLCPRDGGGPKVSQCWAVFTACSAKRKNVNEDIAQCEPMIVDPAQRANYDQAIRVGWSECSIAALSPCLEATFNEQGCWGCRLATLQPNGKGEAVGKTCRGE